MVLLAEKSPSLKEAIESFDEVALEYKYDGARMIIEKNNDGKFWIYTRRLENITKAFPDVVEACKKSLNAKNCIVDGEAVAINSKTKRPMPFQTLSQRIKRKYDIQESIKEIPVQLNLFDIVYLNGETLFDSALEKRREILKDIVKEIPGKIQLAKQLVTKDLKKADEFYKEALKAGHEGLIVKNLEAKYQPGRRVAGGWLKVKPVMESLDLVITGATWGTGKRTGWLGSYILSCRDPDTGKFLECGMLGTGVKEKKTNPEDFTLLEMTKLLKPYVESEKENEVKIKPKVVVEVAYEEIQKSPTYSSGWALRFPRFVRIRWDKSAEEADDLERIKKLYEIQKGKKTDS
jgi:DNA ligase-1